MREIKITRGMVVTVDDEDFEFLSQSKWNVYRRKDIVYAKRHTPTNEGGRTTEYLHRVVLARAMGRMIAKSEQTDHINGNGLDNRRGNLRVATAAQNNRNCRRRVKNPLSQYLGITWRRDLEKWQARIGLSGKNVSLGCYAKEMEAALAREAFIAKHPELYARSNFANIRGKIE